MTPPEDAAIAPPDASSAFSDGIRAAWPICIGYIPIGLAFGVLAQKIGLRPYQIGMMSILVFAGSSQFIAVSMLASGASAGAIIMTTFIVNIRHFLMSSALALHLPGADKKRLSLYAYGVTDESFAVNNARFVDPGWDLPRAIWVNQTANACWIVSTVLGGIGGQYIPERAFGVDYALTAMFICLLVYQLRERRHWIAAAGAGALAVVLALAVPGNSYVVLASVLTATAGTLVMVRRNRGENGND